jgi:putative restriction endonuclease
VKTYVGVTDGDWYQFLAARPMLNEVNFWRPSGGREFRVLTPGEPFFFKTHYPHNRVVGGGFYSGFAQLPISAAWELFGEGNGVDSLAQMRTRVGKYRRRPIAAGEDPPIGCVFVRDTVFFPPEALADPPPHFAANVVQGKSYDLADKSVAGYFSELLAQLLGGPADLDLAWPWHRLGPVYGDPRLAPQRLGQRSFQAVVLNAYGHRCAITGARIRPVLQAAHIRPLPAGGEHRLDNGLLLRSDVHTLSHFHPGLGKLAGGRVNALHRTKLLVGQQSTKTTALSRSSVADLSCQHSAVHPQPDPPDQPDNAAPDFDRVAVAPAAGR